MKYHCEVLKTVFDVRSIVNVSYYKLSRGYSFAGERHPFWECIYVDRGALTLTADAETLALAAGEIAFHRPDEFHAFSCAQDCDVAVISFVSTSPAMRRLEHCRHMLSRGERACLQALMAEAARAYVFFENDPPRVNLQKKADAPWGGDQLIKGYLEQLLIGICRAGDSGGEKPPAPTAQQGRHVALAQQARDYIDQHYAETVTLSALAAVLGVSVTQLKAVFREQTGQTVGKYLTARRIGEARRLIREGDLNFTQVAQRVGYESIYYFSALFKKQMGMSLTEYSKTLKG